MHINIVRRYIMVSNSTISVEELLKAINVYFFLSQFFFGIRHYSPEAVAFRSKIEEFRQIFGSHACHILKHGTPEELYIRIHEVMVETARSISKVLIFSKKQMIAPQFNILAMWRLANLFVADLPSFRELEKEAYPDGKCHGKKLPPNWLG